jgi:hypothetical protein
LAGLAAYGLVDVVGAGLAVVLAAVRVKVSCLAYGLVAVDAGGGGGGGLCTGGAAGAVYGLVVVAYGLTGMWTFLLGAAAICHDIGRNPHKEVKTWIRPGGGTVKRKR